MKVINNITIGSDPEFLVFNPRTNLCYPGLEFTSGTKDSPEDIGGGFYIQKDNALLEGNIPICRTVDEFLYSMNYLIGYLTFLVSSKKLQIIHEDSGEYAPKHLRAKEVNIFGCDPYENVWTGKLCRAPSLSHTNYRTCGFHIHIGYDITVDGISREKINKMLVKAFDMFVTLPSYLIHFDSRRASAYGGLGNYREKVYGVECRSLGSYFTNPERLTWVWNNTLSAIEFCKDTDNWERLESLKVLEDLSSESISNYLKEFNKVLLPF